MSFLSSRLSNSSCSALSFSNVIFLSRFMPHVLSMDQDGWTPALMAAFRGYAGVLKVLIDFKADLNKALPVRFILFQGLMNLKILAPSLSACLSGCLAV